MINLCFLDRLSSRPIVLQTVAEQLSHTHDIRAVSTQERRRLKGADTCLVHEIVCVNHDTGVHRIRLRRLDLDAVVADVLQYLGYHLTRRRCIRLDIR